ncbi:MAG: hypothetical protein Kow0088_11260 [Anaerolineales bacterium]
MNSLTPRQLLDLAGQQGVEGIDLTARVLALTSTFSPPEQENDLTLDPSLRGRRGDTLTPSPSPTGRGENALTLRQELRQAQGSAQNATFGPTGGLSLSKPANVGRGKSERRTWMQTLRARPALLVLILVLVLALISGAAYALSRSWGYLPGVGLVEQSAPLRVLAEPVSQTRQGITITVQEAVLTSERTVIVMTLENLPDAALMRPEESAACYWEPQLRLPTGKTLAVVAGKGSGDAQGRLELRWSYAPIPPNVNEVELFVPCIQGTSPGQAPERWSFKLHFVPAPPDLTVLPVQEVPTPLPTAPADLSPQPAQAWQIEKVIETAEGYILVGTFRPAGLPYNAVALGFPDWIKVTDALGNEVSARVAEDIDLSSPMVGVIPWSLAIQGKGHAWPLTLSVSSLDAETFELSGEFQFDAGENPTAGQTWALNRALQVGKWQIEVLQARFTGKGYEFDLRAADPVKHIELEIVGTHPSGGYGSSDDQGNIQVGLEYKNPPNGQMTVKVTSVIFRVQGDWTIQWMPEDSRSNPTLFGIRLVLDKTVALEDGYLLVGHVEWDDDRISLVTPQTHLFATDAQGNSLDLEQVSFDVFSQVVPDFSNSRWEFWAYRLEGKAFSAPITLHLEKVNLMLASPSRLTLDLRPYGFAFDQTHLDLPYKVGLIPLEGLPELSARLARVTYLRQGELHGFDLYFEADPRLDGLSFQFTEGADAATGKMLIESDRDPSSGFLVARTLTDAILSMPITLSASDFQLQGDWTVQWVP